ncbi:MAG: 4-hydroxy-tetrahydrodipicolinate synthase [Planctomycetes bacterium]|nr:4-hydroxy-tetrahydrodipicolinate synthase [Planctomycetota bacterium]
MKKTGFRGVYTAIVTPFAKDGSIDRERFAEQIEFQIAAGVAGIVPCGTTGESPTLTHEEHEEVVRLAVRQANGRVQVIAGTGSNSTAEALRLTRAAAEAGADGALVITPYYNKPSQEGLYRHFVVLAREGGGLPLVLYNVPGRTGVNLLPETVLRLSEHDRIAGVKEASGSLDQASQILAARPDFTVLSGDDSLTLPIAAVGGKGVISVASNVVPETVREMADHALAGDFAAARETHLRLFPLFRALFLETNPIPVKTAMRLAGRDSGAFRLPLCPMSKENEAKLREVLSRFETLQPA